MIIHTMLGIGCLLYTSDAADDLLCVDLGGRRITQKKKVTNSQRIAHSGTQFTTIELIRIVRLLSAPALR